MSAKHGVMMPEKENDALQGVNRWVSGLRRKILRLYLQYINPKLGKVAEIASEPKDFLNRLLPVDLGKWLAIAAAITGLLVFLLPEDFWAWQIVIFLSIFFLGPVVERFLKSVKSTFYNLLVAYPGKHLLDQEIKLEQPIVDGSSEMTLHGEVWKLMGENTAAGNRVRVIAIKENVLYVVPV